MDDTLIINTGPITSFNSLNYYVSPRLSELRNLIIHGQSPKIVFDLRNVSEGRTSIAALTAFLSLAKRLSDFFGEPIDAALDWNPSIQSFWSNVDFISIAKKLDIIRFDERFLGGFPKSFSSLKTKIIYFDEIPNLSSFSGKQDIYIWKDFQRQQIKERLSLHLGGILKTISPDRNFSSKLESVLILTCAELIKNSLLHGQDFAFVGIQRTKNRVTISVCDSGKGFPASMARNNPELKNKQLSHINSLLIASLLRRNEIGLFKAINDVLELNGWVVMSSFDCEIRWEKELWTRAKYIFNEDNIFEQNVKEVLGESTEAYLERKDLYKGYYKTYKNILVGSRITFEIPI